ncbi:hypothetical protein [uncultured Jatrophihabitans sp.]|uniref:hypothetical protein n=1 Tax=uncultured Jatrophihabitans sp. TaxID=1610747 RepID=UPI0035C98F7F
MRRPAAVVSVALAVGCALGLAACTSTTSGDGHVGSSRQVRSSAPGTTSTGAGAPTSSAGSTAKALRHLTIVGASSHRSYAVTVWDHDTIANCATHAYGATMIKFLEAHPCRGAHRVLGTVLLGGRTVAVSAITTSFRGTGADPYGATTRFIKLEQADGTGSVNDLLREGGSLPGTDEIPPTEAFVVLSQDTGVTVFDAWYVGAQTPDQDPPLVTLERNLYLTRFTSA